MTAIAQRNAQFPGAVVFEPWDSNDGAMNAFFHNNGRIFLPSKLIPDGKPHPFECNGVTHYYVADVDDESGPYVVVFLDRVPLPFFVGVRYQPKPGHLYVRRCAECVRRWVDGGHSFI